MAASPSGQRVASPAVANRLHRELVSGVSPPPSEAGRPSAEARRAVGAGPPGDASLPRSSATTRPDSQLKALRGAGGGMPQSGSPGGARQPDTQTPLSKS